jgi:hypothetical protein
MCQHLQNQITHRHEKLLKIVESLVHANGSKRILGIGSVTGFDFTMETVEDNKEYDTYRQRQLFAEDRYPVKLGVADSGEDTVKIVQLFLTRGIYSYQIL